jgi:uncharacterized membrane protein YGL010W
MRLLIGPMFLVAKLLVDLGLRPDLAQAIPAEARSEQVI